MANFIQVRKAIEKYKSDKIPSWLSCSVVMIPIICLWANFVSPEKMAYANLLWIAALLWWLMVIEDSKTNMLDIRHLACFMVIMLYLANDFFYDSLQIFFFWLSLLELFHTATILIDIGIRSYHNKKAIHKIGSTTLSKHKESLPLLPALSGAICLYSILLLALSYTTDLQVYNAFCSSLSDSTTNFIIDLSNKAFMFPVLLLIINKFFIQRRIIKRTIYLGSAIKELKGFIAPADLLILATFAVFFQQLHFSMIMTLLPFSMRLYQFYKKMKER